MLSINNGTDTNAEVIAFENEFGGPFNHAPAVGIEGGCEAVDTNFGVIGYPSYLLISPENIYLSRIDEMAANITVETFEDSFPAGFDPQPIACTLNVDNNVVPFALELFPNPSNKNGFTVRLNCEMTKMDIQIYTVLGELVYSNTFTEHSAMINPELPSGIYLTQVETTLGRTSKKLIVQ